MLVAVLIGPYFVDWNGFRTTFENRAGDILGQPVHIRGNIDLSMLPTPTITMDDVEVGDTEGAPMATIDHVEIHLELLPLLTGQFNVTELDLDHPDVRATVDDSGALDWTMRPEGVSSVDPAKVALDQIVVRDGALRFYDARTGAAFSLSDIATNQFSARSLNGPWQIDGSLICEAELVCGDGLPVTFTLSSGRLAADGSLRVSAEITPASADLAGTLRTQGVVTREEGLLAYAGTFQFDKLAVTSGAPEDSPPQVLAQAWTIAGGFRLGAEALSLSQFTWESSDGVFSIGGDASLSLGTNASFDATLVSRQIDLDRALGDGDAVAIGDAGSQIWQRLSAAMPPVLAGHATLSIPSVIVSGSVLQNLQLDVTAAGDHWDVVSLQMQLPGQTQLSLAGRFDPGTEPGFAGTAGLSTAQPAVLASWWTGRDVSSLGLRPLSLNATVALAPAGLTLSDAELHAGDDALTGTLAWLAPEDAGGPRRLTADVSTHSFDIDQLRALADLLSGDGSAGDGQSYHLMLAADELRAGDVAIGDVTLDAALTQDVLALNDLTIGDLDGGMVNVTGTLGDLSSNAPRGTLTASLQAEQLDGVVALAQHLAPGTALTTWLEKSAPALAPVDLQAIVTAHSPGGSLYDIGVTGTAAGSTLRVQLNADGGTDDWAANNVGLVVEIDAADSAQLAQQLGLAGAVVAEENGAATIRVSANGVPTAGMAAHFGATIAGVVFASDGTLTLNGAGPPQFAGPMTAQGDLDRLARLIGLTLPQGGTEMPAVLEGRLNIADGVIGLDLDPSSINQRSVAGSLQLTRANGVWDLAGQLNLEELDLGWLMTWPLGIDPLPEGGTDSPWSTEPFTGTLMNGLALNVDVSADRFVVGRDLTIANADLGFTLGDNQARIELRNGSLSTGLVRSTLSLAVEDGQLIFNGQLFLADVPMDALVWRSEGQPVADGVVGLSAEFAAIGRSPAGLVSALAGSGSLDIGQSVFHFMGADAFSLVIRLADEGEATTDDQLRQAFTGFLDAGTLDFGDATVRFDISAGIVTPDTIIQEAGPVQLVARAPIDLNHLTIDSSWELTMIEGRDIGDGPQPRAYVTFAGPLAAPVRQVNVTPLMGYLSLRRLQETEQLQADVLERERFIRLIDTIEAGRAATANVPAPETPANTVETAPLPAPAAAPQPGAGLLIPPGVIPGP